MTQNMKKEPILQMGTDKMIPDTMLMTNHSQSGFLTDVNGKTLKPLGKRGQFGIQMALK
jgi:hypothetical protein